ncbi:DUF72 domain-containing protein [Cognatilysobacter lacus]|uniref:DUF72 domain-containing protein n=1 Tax=Cognatilysobacter lacus TaxID=1643323 RepID=A0A5D8Z5L2_9GAMM|nr:DUF72 domain-containing protein [Lysobacter lacus]TZF90275.1 DUF72 domain-containing protein [Lysobacter lacus]
MAPAVFGTGVPAVDGIRIGIGGWTYAPWRHTFYPQGLVSRRELEYASRRFSTIEINGTFYGARRASEYAQWREQTPPGFVFSVKAPQHITQRGPLARCGKAAWAFLNGGLAELGDRLGPVLWHMPPSRLFDADDLAAFLDLLPRTLDGRPLRHVLEPSHPSFLDPRYIEIARAFGAGTVVTDAPDMPAIGDVTGHLVYVRLMRSRVDLQEGYEAAELDAWLQRLRLWSRGEQPADVPRLVEAPTAQGTPEVYAYFIGGAKQRNPAAAMALIARLLRH